MSTIREEELELFDYRVELDVFAGPLDLLLYLVQRDEIDIFDIPIARITEQYLQYLRVLEQIDMTLAGEFLVMASTLMEIKSRMLLPQAAGDDAAEQEDQEDPRRELVRQLLEYRRFRRAAETLQQLADEASLVYARSSRPDADMDELAQPAELMYQGVQVWDLVAAFGRLMRDMATATAASRVVYDETPIHVHMEQILEQLRRRGQIAFTELFRDRPDRSRMIGIFLALLELVKAGKVRAEQNELFGEIWILPADHCSTGPAAEAG